MDVKKCTTCNIEIDEDNSKKDRKICKNCFDINRKKYNNNTFSGNDNNKKINNFDSVNNKKKTEVVDFMNNNNRILITGFSNCEKTYLMNHILHQKQEPCSIITKSLNQYPNINAQTSDEIQPLENYENSIVVFDDSLLPKHEGNIHLFFTRGRHNNTDIYYITQSFFHLPKKTIRNNKVLFYLNKL